MTAITAAAAPATPAAILPTAARATAVSAAPASRADQPAVINDVASQAAGGVGAVSGDDLPATLRGKVNRVLEDVGSHNSFAWFDKHTDWDRLEAEIGKEKMEENNRSTLASASIALRRPLRAWPTCRTRPA